MRNEHERDDKLAERREPATAEAKLGECMGRWKHTWRWVWDHGEWTHLARCTTCGELREIKRWQGQ